MNCALTVYPLSNAFRRRLEDVLEAEPVYLNLAEFRTLGPAKMIARLRTLRGMRLVLPLEDENSHLIMPALLAVAAVSNAATIEIRHPDLRAERVSRWQLVRGLCAVAWASVGGMVAALASRRELAALVGEPRIVARPGAEGTTLYVNANLWFGVKAGGSIGHVAGVANALNRRGGRVTYASAGGRTMIDDAVGLMPLRPPRVFGFPPELNQYRFQHLCVEQLRTLPKPRFIYQRMSIANYTGAVLSRRWGVPLVLEYNGSEVWIAKNWGRPLRYQSLASAAEDASLRHAHVVVTVSEALRDELVARGVAPERVVCYPNCVDPEVFDPSRFSIEDARQLRRRHGLSTSSLLATFIGTFGQWHGVDVLAKAIRLLVDEDREWLASRNVHFLLVGDGLKMPLVREALGQGCEAFVTLTGLVPQAEAPAYLAASDILLSPHVANQDGSRFFGSPTKLFEYMAMGKAIVASDLDQIGQVLANSLRLEHLPTVPLDPDADEARMAVLCPPGDVRALASAIKFTVDRTSWRTALGRNVRREALSKYTWDNHVSAITDRLDALSA